MPSLLIGIPPMRLLSVKQGLKNTKPFSFALHFQKQLLFIP